MGQENIRGFGGGCISISIGLVHFLRSLAKIDGNTPPRHAPDMLEDDEEVKNFPTPQWLNRRVLNWAVVGGAQSWKPHCRNMAMNPLLHERIHESTKHD